MMTMTRLVAALVLSIALTSITTIDCNSEVDILTAWKVKLVDPNNVLQSWDPTLINPCTWLHVTCNLDNAVTRLDLGNAGLSGILVPELAKLSNLQYLQVEKNKISGSIPRELGNLTNLISLGLSQNRLSGSIPASLGNLRSLRFMRLSSNKLSGIVPDSVLQLIIWGNLETLDISDNRLAGTVRRSNTKGFKITSVIQDPKA